MTDLVFYDPATFSHGPPLEEFRRMRDTDPVSHHDHPYWERGYWALTRHADVVATSRDSVVFRNSPHPLADLSAAAAGDEEAGLAELLISKDQPEHTQLRKLVSAGFTPRRVADLSRRIHERVDTIIASLGDATECDLVTDVAVGLPLHVIADLVGIPEDDRAQVFEWTEQMFGFDPTVTEEQRSEAAMNTYLYADGLCEQRRADPRDDLISVLLDAEVDGDQLTQVQIDVFFMMLQNAGSETTRNLITSGTLALLANPEQTEAIRADLSTLPLAIEELLRYTTPVMQFFRRAAVDTEIDGVPIAADDRVLLVYSSANHDERAFVDPERLDLARTPNPHVGFGAGGPHFCLGANLARLEARAMFEAIVTRFENLEVAAPLDSLPRLHSCTIQGFAHVPVRWSHLR